MKIIKEKDWKTVVSYFRSFSYRDNPGSGYMFECDVKGNLKNPHENYGKCLDGTYDVIDCGVKKVEHEYEEPAIGVCEYCNRRVELDRFTNSCDCGVDYNWCGQELCSRSYWGEETGESLSDIMRIK